MENDLVIAVGDIHGRADLLSELQKNLSHYAKKHNAKNPLIVYLGDYVDRGPEASRVIDLLMDGLPDWERIYLIGNHEQMMIDAVFSPLKETDLAHWLKEKVGGMATLDSYGFKYSSRSEAENNLNYIHANFFKNLSNRQVQFFKSLQYFQQTEDSIFVHAGLNPSKTFDQQTTDDVLWIRDIFLNSDKDWGRKVYHGHTTTAFGPTIRENRVNLDTGAYETGILTACVVGDHPHFITGTIKADNVLIFNPNPGGDDYWRQWTASIVASSEAKVVHLYDEGDHGEFLKKALRGKKIQFNILSDVDIVNQFNNLSGLLGKVYRRRDFLLPLFPDENAQKQLKTWYDSKELLPDYSKI